MGKGRAASRARLFVGNRGSGQLFAESVRSGPRKVTRGQLWDMRHIHCRQWQDG